VVEAVDVGLIAAFVFGFFLELRVMEVVVTIETIWLAKLRSPPPIPNFFAGRSPNQQCQSTEGRLLDIIAVNYLELMIKM